MIGQIDLHHATRYDRRACDRRACHTAVTKKTNTKQKFQEYTMLRQQCQVWSRKSGGLAPGLKVAHRFLNVWSRPPQSQPAGTFGCASVATCIGGGNNFFSNVIASHVKANFYTATPIEGHSTRRDLSTSLQLATRTRPSYVPFTAPLSPCAIVMPWATWVERLHEIFVVNIPWKIDCVFGVSVAFEVDPLRIYKVIHVGIGWSLNVSMAPSMMCRQDFVVKGMNLEVNFVASNCWCNYITISLAVKQVVGAEGLREKLARVSCYHRSFALFASSCVICPHSREKSLGYQKVAICAPA